MRPTRQVTFSVVDDGSLQRTVNISDGRSYTHYCSRETYEQVAYAFEDQKGHTHREIAESLDLPHTQTTVAMEFMKERGVIEVRYKRRSYAASDVVFEDAMIEYLALKEKGQEGDQ